MSRWERFWFDTPVLRDRLTTLRVVFFGLLAFDMWVLMVPHAARYGAGGFNVTHFAWLDGIAPLPTPAIICAAYLLGGYLALQAALGIAIRASIIGTTVLYGVPYFWSQADSYQHHYLIALLLVLMCFVPFDRAPDGEPPSASPQVRSAGARLIYAQVAIVYLYTAVTKTSGFWLDGSTLMQIIHVPWVRELHTLMAGTRGISEISAYAVSAYAVMSWQFIAAAAFLVPALRPFACLTGPAFHLLVEGIELQIGWFSFYMIGLYYILLFPDRWFLWMAAPVKRLLGGVAAGLRRLPSAVPLSARTVPWLGLATAAIAAAIAFEASVPGATATLVGIAVTVVAVALHRPDVPRPWTRAGLQHAMAASMVLSLTATDAAYDFWRYWGGDLKRRGAYAAAVHKYARANALKPDEVARRFHQAELHVRLGEFDDARRLYEEGLTLDPAEVGP